MECAAVGLASGIVQFLTFGGKITVEVIRCYKSADGKPKYVQNIKNEAEDGLLLAKKNRTDFPNDTEFVKDYDRIEETSKELLRLVKNLNLDSKQGKLIRAVVASVKVLRVREDLEDGRSTLIRLYSSVHNRHQLLMRLAQPYRFCPFAVLTSSPPENSTRKFLPR